MTVLGWTVSDVCAQKIEEVEKIATKRLMYANEELEGCKSKFVSKSPYFHMIYLDMTQISVGEDFEEHIMMQLDRILEFEENNISDL